MSEQHDLIKRIAELEQEAAVHRDTSAAWRKHADALQQQLNKQGEVAKPPECRQDRRWGIIRVAMEFETDFFCHYLPPDHRIVASKHDEHCSYVEHIIEGPDMPLHAPEKKPEMVALLTYMDDSSITYGYWGHMQDKRWPISAGSALVGD